MQPATRDPHRLVTLRPARPPDAALLYRWRGEPSVARHQPLGEVSAGQIRAELSQQRPEALARGRGEKFQWIVEVDARPAGWITLVVTNWDHGVSEFGYALSTRFQGRGLMVPALEQFLAELFLTAPLERLEARCSIDNVASQRVLERLGFEREGKLRGYFELRGERVDNYLYALLRSDWAPRR